MPKAYPPFYSSAPPPDPSSGPATAELLADGSAVTLTSVTNPTMIHESQVTSCDISLGSTAERHSIDKFSPPQKAPSPV